MRRTVPGDDPDWTRSKGEDPPWTGTGWTGVVREVCP